MESTPAGVAVPGSVQVVIYIDDESAAFGAVREALESQGITVLCYSNPEEAYARHLESGAAVPGGFLIDGQIPGHDMNAFCRELNRRRIPYLRVTARVESIDSDCTGVGADGTMRPPLAKPISAGILRYSVRAAFFCTKTDRSAEYDPRLHATEGAAS